ncbi:hypothetical protein ILUMI_09723, partial [Ignelater luminosus]
LWSIERNKVVVSRNVKFNEREFPYLKEVSVIKQGENIIEPDNSEITKFQQEVEEDKLEGVPDGYNQEYNSKRNRQLPIRFNDYELYLAYEAFSYFNDVPQSFQEINSKKDADMWKKAIKRELSSINENETWKVVKTSENTTILDSKWVFAFKEHEEDTQNRYKARLVARGFAQPKEFNLSSTLISLAGKQQKFSFLAQAKPSVKGISYAYLEFDIEMGQQL